MSLFTPDIVYVGFLEGDAPFNPNGDGVRGNSNGGGGRGGSNGGGVDGDSNGGGGRSNSDGDDIQANSNGGDVNVNSGEGGGLLSLTGKSCLSSRPIECKLDHTQT